ncbi:MULTISPECIES: porin [unclassified Sphingomonas]|uniref:porin n=1 Tax=unclassified Sphingomonas TaxID=196159 RepID=UPI001D11B546|nr:MULTISPECIES: porin [unclassified Sphingomonas]MCC2979209.1 OprO/OprP family phosphate-selective porin [Sphingomonas sp. IC4-52]MCD2315557.1 OprO/OprP family phosphate-selective porin [Sphingomonas sp. IC-11]
MRHHLRIAALMLGTAVAPVPAQAQTVQDLQRQIDDLKAQLQELIELQKAKIGSAPSPEANASSSQPASAAAVGVRSSQPPAVASAPPPVMGTAERAPTALQTAEGTAEAPVSTATPSVLADAGTAEKRPWYKRISLRGYTQVRLNEIISGDASAPAGRSRLRTPGDSGITDQGNFTFRRIRLVFSGDISDEVSFYFQPDFANAISNQSNDERREGFAQLRDAYVDWFPNGDRRFRLRVGQSKVPFGWENLQSSSNRLTLDRSDGINSAIPSERDLGVVGFFTPPSVQQTWDRLAHDGQKLFGNYGAFGVGFFNGQGVNRTERNNGLMTVAMATWPFELDSLGPAFHGQVLELGGAVMRNRVRPEVRTGGVSAKDFQDDRVGFHAILYPQPFGLQAEWNWGRGPEFDPLSGTIVTRDLNGGYIQGMARVRQSPLGPFMPYLRWQRYRGGWKAITNAPRLETNELELGIEFQPIEPLEVTIAYADMTRREPDERRLGRAEGQLIRTQLQWNY